MIDENRGKDGRFLRGNKPSNLQDKTTGRFIAKSMVKSEDEYEKKSRELNKFLKSLETENED